MQETRAKFLNRIKGQVGKKILQQDVAFFESTTPAWVMQQVMASSDVAEIPASLVPALLDSLFSIGTAFTILSRFDMMLAGLCVFSVPANLLFAFVYAQYVQQLQVQRQRTRGRMSSAVQELVNNAKTCRLFSAGDQKMRDYWEEADEMITLVKRNSRVTAAAGIVESLVPHVMSMLMFTYAARLVAVGKMSFADMMIVGMYQDTLSGAFSTIPAVINAYGSVMGQNKKVFQILERCPKMFPRGTLHPERIAGRIEFRDVSFQYTVRKRHNAKDLSMEESLARNERVRLLKLERRAQNTSGSFEDPLDDLADYEEGVVEVKVLEKFNLSVKAGEKIALVGRSGSGKTTVANLVLGLYDACQGSVLVDDKEVHTYDPEWYYTEGVSVVSQMPSLLNGTFEENLLLGLKHKGLGLDDLEKACKDANAHDFIVRSIDGYNTNVGKNGGKISGGQRQRVAIARALLRNPSILVLDEATSALDAEAEHLVQQAIEKAMEGRTVLMIAHRLSTIQSADRILVMDAGKIVEEGTHAHLLQLDGLYAQLVQKQLINEEATGQEQT